MNLQQRLKMVAEQWVHAGLYGTNFGLNISMKRAAKCSKFLIFITVILSSWCWRKHSSHGQVLEEENWFDIIFWEVTHIPWLNVRLVVFISKPPETELIAAEQRQDEGLPATDGHFYWDVWGWCKVMESPRDSFPPPALTSSPLISEL